MLVEDLRRGEIGEVLTRDQGLWLLLLLGAAVVLVLVGYGSTRIVSVSRKRDLVDRLLATSAMALIFPASSVPIRVSCRLHDRSARMLNPFTAWSQHVHDDFHDPVPCDGPDSGIFVIVRALKQNRTIAEDLPNDHLDHTPASVHVWRDLKSVLAAPIRDFNDLSPEAEVLGVLAFDSAKPLSENLFDSATARDICCAYASCIFRLLKEG
jgi:hypothetical protein